MDDATDMVEVAELATRFFEHESCGKCTPCREGTYWLSRVYARMRQGRARADDVELLSDILRQMTGRCFCLLGEFATTVPESTIRHYRDEYERYVADGDGK